MRADFRDAPLKTPVALGVFLPTFFLSVYSIVDPVAFAGYVDLLCEAMVHGCDLSQFYRDGEILTNLGFGEHALGCSALRRIGIPLLAANLSVLFIYSVVNRSNFKRNVDRLKFILTIAACPLLVWWLFFSPDFYSAYDGDFSGAFRPYMGSIAYGFGIVFISYLLTAIVFWLIWARIV